MPLCFQPESDSSFDPGTDVSIPQPRILPTTLQDGRPGTEYQYAFIREGKMIGGLGFSGSDAIVETGGQREWVFTLDLGREHLITAMLEFKQTLANQDEDFDFIRGLAQGLVLAYSGRTDSGGNVRYIAVTTAEALDRAGVSIPGGRWGATGGTMVLAEVAIPAHLG